MSSKKQALLLLIRIGTDVTMVCCAWLIAYYFRFYTFLDVPRGIPSELLYFKLLPFIGVIWLAVFYAAGFYRRSVGERSAFVEAIDILQSCILATLAFIAFSYFYEEYRYSRIVLLVFAIVHPAMLISGRSAIRKALRYYRRHAPPRGILIIGSDDLLKQAIYLTQVTNFQRQKIMGAILVGDDANIESSRAVCNAAAIPVLEREDSWPAFFTKHPHIHTVYLAVPYKSYGYIEEHIATIADQVTDIKVIPDILRYTKFAAGIDILRGVPVVNIHESPLEGMGAVIKRLVDILGASIGLVILSPVLAIIAALVKLSSPGPIIYKQERMGLDGKTFHCFKFRSMPVDVESQSGPVWASKGENRSTKIGGLLRRYSLDEFPQLLNVVLGQMSLVGPRPERPVFVHEFRQKVPGYMLRHKVKAGITGWAQVNGWRGNTSIEKRIEFDLFYIQNWSLWLDLRIIGMTVHEVFFGKNAY